MPSPFSQLASAPPAAALPADLLDLSVVIVNYNVRAFLEQTLRSVEQASAGLDVEVFVVDNNSVDGSVEMVRQQFPDVRLIVNDENTGFSRANNQAIRQARGQHVLLLNPDTIVQEDTFAELLRFMDEHPDAGAVGCKILNPDGTFAPESRRAFPTPSVALYRMVGLSRLFPESRRFGRYNMSHLPCDEACKVDALSGSCMLVRRAALSFSRSARENGEAGGECKNGRFSPNTIQHPASTRAEQGEATDARNTKNPKFAIQNGDGAGLLDEDFFMYGEDLDWCYRIQQAGWNVYYTPDTQIIHYKGESTKKSELRYVRRFYKAMLQFAEKHFQDRYSRLYAGFLRVGILAHAGLTVMRRTLHRLAGPGRDFSLVFLVVALLGVLHSTLPPFAPLFFATVASGYAVSTVAGIAAAGGYRTHKRQRLRPVVIGTTLALLLISTASFFVKSIAFSRAVVLASWPVATLLLGLWRLHGRAQNVDAHRTVLVGSRAEAQRLKQMLAGHPQPPLELIGYVESEGPAEDDLSPDAPPRLGALSHLRDLIRLRRARDVVFAADELSNRTIFRLMQQLRDLPVRFLILAAGCEHVLGKTAVEHLSAPALIDAEDAVGELRSPMARRAFEIPVALLGLLLYPLLRGAARLAGPASFYARLAQRLRALPDVLRGRKALIGYDPAASFRPPPEWNLKPGLFAVSDTLTTPQLDDDATNRAYWFYVTHQSFFLDGDFLLRAMRKLNEAP